MQQFYDQSRLRFGLLIKTTLFFMNEMNWQKSHYIGYNNLR